MSSRDAIKLLLAPSLTVVSPATPRRVARQPKQIVEHALGDQVRTTRHHLELGGVVALRHRLEQAHAEHGIAANHLAQHVDGNGDHHAWLDGFGERGVGPGANTSLRASIWPGRTNSRTFFGLIGQ